MTQINSNINSRIINILDVTFNKREICKNKNWAKGDSSITLKESSNYFAIEDGEDIHKGNEGGA